MAMKLDIIGIISLSITLISILFSFNLSILNIVISTSVFLIALAIYLYFIIRTTIDEHSKEITKINEKINIHKEISDIKAKVDLLFNEKMNYPALKSEVSINKKNVITNQSKAEKN